MGFEIIIIYYSIIFISLTFSLYLPKILSIIKQLLKESKIIHNTLAYLVIVFILAFLIIVLFDSFEGTGDDIVENYSSLLTTNATIIATILAVSFSLSVFAIQYTAGNFTPSIVRSYFKEPSVWITFSLFSLSSFLNLIALVFPPSNKMVFLSLFLSAYSFLLLAYHFIHTFKYSNTITIIQTIENSAIKEIDLISKNLESKLITPLSKIVISHSDIRRTSILNNPETYENILREVSFIIDLIKKTASKGEIETADIGCSSIVTIVRKYIDLRKNANVLPDNFLDSIYIELNTLSFIGFNNNDVNLLKILLKAYTTIAISITKLIIQPSQRREYHSIYMANSYIKEISVKALTKELVDASIHAVNSIAYVGNSALEHDKGYAMSFLHLRDISFLAILKIPDYYMQRQIIQGIASLFYTCIKKGIDIATISVIEKPIQEVCLLCINNLDDMQSNLALLPIIEHESLGFHNSFAMVAKSMIFLFRDTDTERVRNPHKQRYFNQIIEKILYLLYTITLEAAEKKYAFVVGTTSKSIFDIVLNVIKEDNQAFQEELDEILYSTFTRLSTIYTSFFKEKGDLSYYVNSELSDHITLLALESIQINKNIFAMYAINALLEIGNHIINFDKSGINTVRIALRIWMIKLYAHYKGNTQLIDESEEKIKELVEKNTNVAVNKSELAKEIERFKEDLAYEEIFLDYSPQNFIRDNIDKSWLDDNYNKCI